MSSGSSAHASPPGADAHPPSSGTKEAVMNGLPPATSK